MARKRVKRYLTLLMAIGVIAVVAGGSGTFASFTAEVTHTGNTFATGTLLLHSTHGTTTCASESNSSNANTGCSSVFSVQIAAPGTGTVAAAGIAASTTTSIPVANLTANVEPGDKIKVTSVSTPANTDTFTATAAVTAAASVSIPVISTTPAHAYVSGDTVAVQTYTSYASIQLKNAGTLDAKNIKFAIPSCANSASQTLTLGTTTGTLTAGTLSSASIGISAAAYGAPSSATITVADATNSDTLTLGAAVNPGATSITASGTLSHSYSSGATVKYNPFISGSGTLCGGLDYTIVETDASFNHDSSNAAQKCSYPTSSATTSGIGCTFASGTNLGGGPTTDTALDISNATTGTGTTNTAGELDNGNSRYFVIGVQADVAGFSNTDQNQTATFSVKWHIDQK